MIPMALVQMENYPGFLCSYDNVNWWKTEALPNTIDKIIGTEWIYGEHHIFACSNLDGTYSIYQSYHAVNDNVADLHWRETLNTAERIRCLIRPDYGRALIGTSLGWWRSENAGKDFTKVSTSAPDCICIKELTNDILIAISKNNIWRSENCGTGWTSVKSSVANIDYPAIDGTYYDVLVGIGNALWYSGDGALHFTEITSKVQGFTKRYPITDIELSGTGTDTVDNVPTFVVQCLMPNGKLRHYYLIRHVTDVNIYFYATAKFDGFSSLSNSLTSEEIQETGSSDISSIVMFSGSDETGPILKESDDGGENWDTIDVQNATIYDSSELDHIIDIGGPFLDGTYFKAGWSHMATCHNYWHIYDTHLKKNQSYDIGALILNYHSEIKTYNAKAYADKKLILPYYMAGRLLGVPIKTYNSDFHLGKDTLKTYNSDVFLEGFAYKTYYVRGAVQDIGLSSYLVNGRIVLDEFPRLVGPQALDWRFPAFSEAGWPYDSRNEV
jgi:hypothetical protein